MQKRRLQKEKRREKGCFRTTLLFAAGVALLCFGACGKQDKEQGDTVSLTPGVTQGAAWEGFAEANEALVAYRAATFASTVAVSVGDMDITMDKAMYLIYMMEVRGNSYALSYEAQFGTDYWEMVYDEQGRTTRDVFKEETMDALIQYAVLYDCALENEMSLTREEMEENNTYVERIKELMSAEEAERGGFTTENLREVCAWMRLAEKYYDRMTEKLGITKESVRETINKAEYKEYETEYLYLANTYYDEEYNICEESKEVKQANFAQMQDYYEQVAQGVTFETLAGMDDALVWNTRTFLEKGDGAETAYAKAAAELAVGEVCAPVETEYGIYLIRMVDDACTQSYEAAVNAEYELQRSEAFEAAYEVLLSAYEVTINEEAWGDIVFGATVNLIE